ncbi:hypothetical protein [Waltera sp.]|uniref:hypothetical protein n=1 Tax=Waltera sp. TaxID=2815806 RepID=UPI0039A35258
MNMNIKENNKYRYTDTAERNIRMNRFYIIASSLLAIVFLFYLWLKLVNHNIAPIVTYANTILIAVFCVVNAVTHLRNKATRLLKVFATIEIGIEYLLVGLQTDASFIHYALIAIFILQIPYYEKKISEENRFGIIRALPDRHDRSGCEGNLRSGCECRLLYPAGIPDRNYYSGDR